MVNITVSAWARRAFLLAFCFFSACTSVFYQPDRVQHYPPQDYGYEPKQIVFKSRDSTRLVAWFFPALKKPVLGTLVQFHGNAQNISSHYLALVWATNHGYNLFTFDYRGYGLSAGQPTPEGVHEDAVTALEFAYQKVKTETDQGNGAVRPKFIVFGQSLGGAIAMRAHDDFSHRGETDLIVIDSSFASYKGIAKRTLASKWQTWLLSPLAPMLVSDEFASVESLKNNTRPLLIIHDRLDPAVPYEEGRRVFDLATAKKDFWETNVGGHIDFFSERYPQNRKRFLEYLAALPS